MPALSVLPAVEARSDRALDFPMAEDRSLSFFYVDFRALKDINLVVH